MLKSGNKTDEMRMVDRFSLVTEDLLPFETRGPVCVRSGVVGLLVVEEDELLPEDCPVLLTKS